MGEEERGDHAEDGVHVGDEDHGHQGNRGVQQGVDEPTVVGPAVNFDNHQFFGNNHQS